MTNKKNRLSRVKDWFQGSFWIVSSIVIALGAVVLAESIHHSRSTGGYRGRSSNDDPIALWHVETLELGFGVFLICLGVFYGLKHLRNR